MSYALQRLSRKDPRFKVMGFSERTVMRILSFLSGLHFMTIYSRDEREVSIGAVMRRTEYSHVAHRTVDVWYVKLRVAGTGRLLNQGQWFPTACLRADNGWKEIQKALRAAGDPSEKTARKKSLALM